MVLQRRQRLLGESGGCVGLGRSFLFEFLDVAFVVLDHALGEAAVEAIARQHLELEIFGLGHHAGTGGRIDANLLGDRDGLLVVRAVVLYQHGAKLLDRVVLALLLGQLAVVDLGVVALDRVLDEALAILVGGLVLGESRPGKRQRGRQAGGENKFR